VSKCKVIQPLKVLVSRTSRKKGYKYLFEFPSLRSGSLGRGTIRRVNWMTNGYKLGNFLNLNIHKALAMNKVDAYIAKAAPFAQPILEYLRETVYKACPHAEEAIKWGMPIFETYGTNMCSMAAFKQYCSFGFWKGSLLEDKQGILDPESAMGSLGKITSLKDLPSEKILISYLREADRLNRDNIKVPKVAKEKKELITPKELAAALAKKKTKPLRRCLRSLVIPAGRNILSG
jgi:uncharacterized protein YdeI (YjbR/CyaY-like superfamily)